MRNQESVNTTFRFPMIIPSISFISPSHFLFNDPSGDQEKERERERKRNGGCQTGRGNEKEGKETTDRSVLWDCVDVEIE